MSRKSENLKDIKQNWEEFARADPLWAILPLPEKKNNRWTIEDLYATGEEEIDRVLSELKRSGIGFARKNALDFGCGTGRLTQALARRFSDTVGIDIAQGMVEIAERNNRFPATCHYFVNTGGDLSRFENSTFDFIYSNIVFQHLPPQYTLVYVAEFIRLLRPGGVAVFQVATQELPLASTRLRHFLTRIMPAPLRRAYKRWKYGTWAIKEMYCLDPTELERLIVDRGGRVLQAVEDRQSLPRYKGLRYAVTRG